ncbi:hypothetical protein TNCV_3935081 [Trichonephila clavipes]|nr:hypothetical protein TNCV_3935081 [Trichonephila clavipes]
MEFSFQQLIKRTYLFDRRPSIHSLAHVGRDPLERKGEQAFCEEEIPESVFPVSKCQVDGPSVWFTRYEDVHNLSRDRHISQKNQWQKKPRQKVSDAHS